jgi:glycolate oxidase
VDAAALLIVELDGPEAECAELTGHVRAIAASAARTSCGSSHARPSGWPSGPGARRFPAVGPDRAGLLLHGRHHPARKLPQVLTRITESARDTAWAWPTSFHAGDGNLHPLILYDADKPGELERPRRSARHPEALRRGRAAC